MYSESQKIFQIAKYNLKYNEEQYIFHAGTRFAEGKIYSNGGRVLNFVSLDKNLKNARARTINLINDLKWDKGYFRKDIGYKVIE